MRKAVILGSMLAFGGSGAALAEGNFSYSYAEAGYITSENGGSDGDGLNLFASGSVTDMLHVFGSYSTQGFDFDVDVEFMQLGLGVNFTLVDNLDLVTRLSLVEVQVDGPGFSFDDDGYQLGAFIRGRVAEQWELTAGLNYQDLDNGGEDDSLTAGARYYFTDKFAAGLDLLQNDDDTTFILGARYDFRPR
jgi:hypothetical protein